MSIDRDQFKRATIKVALFFSLIVNPIGSAFAQVPAKPTTQKRETYLDIIEKAQNLSLQKDRNQAVNLLINSYKKENKKAQPEIYEALELIARFFYTDKSQQLYELALPSKTQDLKYNLSKLNEALKLEPDNLLLLEAVVTSDLSNSDCSPALTKAKKLYEGNPVSESIQLLLAQSYLCSGMFKDYGALINTDKKSNYAIFWQALEVEFQYKTGQLLKAKELATQITKQHENYPEAYYWLWKVNLELKIKDEKNYLKYLSLCKTVSSKQIRSYVYEPNFCHHMSEVEATAKKMENMND